MKKNILLLAAAGLIVPVLIFGAVKGKFVERLITVLKVVEPLHEKMDKPKSGDWLSRFKESGQTFNEYLRISPVKPSSKRKYIYIRPVGVFTHKQREIVRLTAKFIEIYFGIPVKVRKDLPMTAKKVTATGSIVSYPDVPVYARRIHWGDHQILATYILDNVLLPELPLDAAAYLALTSYDLYPKESWNFVFGLACFRKRTGVFSIYRYGNPELDKESFTKVLRRTLKVSTHETFHMFSVGHCTAYKCNMNGSNSLKESDRQPLWLCPEDVAKMAYISKTDPVKRYAKLAKFCRENNLDEEAGFFERSIKALESKQKKS